MNQESDERFCARCKRPNPDPCGLPLEWEVLVDQAGEVLGVICEGCVTLGEERAMVDDILDIEQEPSDDQKTQ